MKLRRLKFALVPLFLITLAAPVLAKVGKLVNLSISEAMEQTGMAERAQEKHFEFYWADQVPTRKVEREIEEDNFTKSASIFGRSSKKACFIAFEELLDKLILEARERDANAIIAMTSFHDELQDFSSATEFRCDVGSFRSVVGFRLKFVRLAPQ